MSQAARVIEGVELPPAGTYAFDPAHTEVAFVARHMLSKVRGKFEGVTGTIEIGDGPEDSKVEVELDAASITTGTQMRDDHLRSGDFLLVEEHPTLTFTSTGVRITGERTFDLTGDLTIKGITKPVTLKAEFLGWGPNHQGTPMLAFEAKATIAREDWDITWNVAVETGGFLVGKKVDIEINVEALPVEA
ncbi:MAG TPA: YceI family protein [Actinomycetota bacterium]|jgi:polyisoprenoid-binding protein YceI